MKKIITEITEKCEYENCNEKATSIACGREPNHDVGCYCDKHADIVADEHAPEYIVCCPNCGCQFGVN